MDGLVENWSHFGDSKTEEIYTNGVKISFKEFNSNGNLSEIKHYNKDGKRNGSTIEYDYKGRLKCYINFRDDKPIGLRIQESMRYSFNEYGELDGLFEHNRKELSYYKK